jgi:hypothetical protein
MLLRSRSGEQHGTRRRAGAAAGQVGGGGSRVKDAWVPPLPQAGRRQGRAGAGMGTPMPLPARCPRSQSCGRSGGVVHASTSRSAWPSLRERGAQLFRFSRSPSLTAERVEKLKT